MQKPQQPLPSVIEDAPGTSVVDFDAAESAKQLQLNAQLSAENEKLKAETERRDPKSVRAGMMEPYAKKVFRYLRWYTISVGVILILHGFRIFGFHLPDMTLSILVGSTAVSAIGLVRSIVNGLFGPHPEK